MRVFDTNRLLDKHRTLIYEFYAAKLGVALSDTSRPAESFRHLQLQQAPLKPIMELRLYHLPPYGPLPPHAKLRANALTADDNVERYLMYDESVKFRVHPYKPDLALYQSIEVDVSDAVTPAEAKVLLHKRRMARYPVAEDHTPSAKKLFMAAEVGCHGCGARGDHDIWAADLVDWKDGYCPTCSPIPGNWYEGPYGMQAGCAMCGSSHIPYALWGMCDACYMQWQDSYLDPLKLHLTAKRYGSHACLLISPTIPWVSYLRDHLPHNKPSNVQLTGDLVPLNPTLRQPRRLRTCADAGINLKELIQV